MVKEDEAMSATNRGSKRRPYDQYYTPHWVVHRLLEAIWIRPGDWLEPCVGGGDIVKAVDSWFSKLFYPPVSWTTIDIDPSVDADICADYTHRDIGELPGYPWSVGITNVPYNQALEVIDQMLRDCKVVAALLRLDWIASGRRSGRQAWLKAHMPSVYVIPNRPSFDGVGTDACEYAWMVWRGPHGSGRFYILNETPPDVIKAEKKRTREANEKTLDERKSCSLVR